MSEKYLTYAEYWEDNEEFYLEEMILEAAECNSERDWITDYKYQVRAIVKDRTGHEVPDWDWIKTAMRETKDIELAAEAVIAMVADLDPPETVRNTPTLSAYERNQ